jgi:hypothetical protein
MFACSMILLLYALKESGAIIFDPTSEKEKPKGSGHTY